MKEISGFQRYKRNTPWLKYLLWKIMIYRRNHFNYYRILNPSIIDYKGRRLIAFRDFCPCNSFIRIAELAGNKILNVKQVLGEKGVSSVEDPRFFLHKDKIHLSYVKGKWDSRAAQGGYSKMAYCVLDDDLSVSENKVFDGFEGIQKNWLFFESPEKKLYAITYNHIQQIFDVENNIIIENDFKIEWPSPKKDNPSDKGKENIVGSVRGGSTPIFKDGEYYSFFHVTPIDKYKKSRVPNYCYEVGFYSFESSPPFRITGYTPDPIFTGNPYALPNGAIFEKGKWLVSCGINDVGWKLLKFDHNELLNKMVRVK